MSASSGECDQVVVHGGVAGKHHHAVRGVEPVGEGGVAWPWVTGTVVTRTIPSSNTVMGSLRVPCTGAGTGMSTARTRRSRVRHVTVQGHDVQVIGVSGENVVDQIRHSWEGSFRVDGRLPSERRFAGGSDVGGRVHRRTPVGAGRHPPRRAPPRIQEHACEVPGVVDMEVTEEDSLQPREVEPCLGERGWRPPPAVDDEDASVDDES